MKQRGQDVLRTAVYTVQSIPSLVLIFLAMYGLPQIGLCTPPFITVILCLGLMAAAYISEVFRGALQSIDKRQIDAGLALGMRRRTIFRSVLMPQMLRYSFPGLINEFSSVLKASPFAYIAGVPEILKEAQTITAVTMRGLPVYAAAALLFLALYLCSNALFQALNRHYHVPGLGEE
ncbi:MAG: ABC transporter permease subunit [Lentisphaerota bacterium]